MFEFFKKNRTLSSSKFTRDIKADFKKSFLRDANHQWINEDRVTKRSIETLLDSLTSKQIQFFTKHPTFMIPCQAHLSCAIGRTQNHHLILDLYIRMEENDFYFTLIMQSEPVLKKERFHKNERLLQVQKRLEALYAGNHEFKIFAEDGRLIISLTMLLKNSTEMSGIIAEQTIVAT